MKERKCGKKRERQNSRFRKHKGKKSKKKTKYGRKKRNKRKWMKVLVQRRENIDERK